MSQSTEKVKKVTKFNYLISQQNKQKLSKYDKLNFSPNLYRRSYESVIETKNKQTSVDKSKQNMIRNINKNFETNTKVLEDSNQQNEGSNKKHGLISFGKNKNFIQKSYQTGNLLLENRSGSKQQHIKIVDENNRGIQRYRNKSFGNISFKRPAIGQQKYGIQNNVQFSPYQQQLQQRRNYQLNKDSSGIQEFKQRLYKQEQNLLIYELEQQQLIVRKQLKQLQYQNDLLKQKITYLQNQNLTLKDRTQKKSLQFEQKQKSYQKRIQSLNLDIKELQEQENIWRLQNQQLILQLNNHKNLNNSLQLQISILNEKALDLQSLLNSKDDIIVQLRTKLQLLSIDQQNYIDYQRNKRRKSLDLTKEGRRMPLHYISHYMENQADNQIKVNEKIDNNQHQHGKLVNKSQTQNQFSKDNSKLKLKDLSFYQNNYNSHVSPSLTGDKFYQTNKINFTQNQNKKLPLTDKYQNLIDSIKSMYFKVTNKESKDLKQLWKWLKHITHQYQSFSVLYSLKDSILAVLDDLQSKNQSKQLQKQFSFMDRQCYKIIKKLTEIVVKND